MREINITQLNSIANKVKEVLNKGIMEGKSVFDIIESGGVREFLGRYDAFAFDESTQYNFYLGRFDGRITKTDLDKEKVSRFGCTRIFKFRTTFTIEEKFEENKVIASASINVNWRDKYGCWTEENITIKEWELI